MKPTLKDYALTVTLVLTLSVTWYYMYVRHADAFRSRVDQCMTLRGDMSEDGYNKCLRMMRTR